MISIRFLFVYSLFKFLRVMSYSPKFKYSICLIIYIYPVIVFREIQSILPSLRFIFQTFHFVLLKIQFLSKISFPLSILKLRVIFLSFHIVFFPIHHSAFGLIFQFLFKMLSISLNFSMLINRFSHLLFLISRFNNQTLFPIKMFYFMLIN